MKIRVRELRKLVFDCIREAKTQDEGEFYKNSDVVRHETDYSSLTIGDIIIRISACIESPSEQVSKLVSLLTKVRDAHDEIRGVSASELIKKFLKIKLSKTDKTVDALKTELRNRLDLINIDSPKNGAQNY